MNNEQFEAIMKALKELIELLKGPLETYPYRLGLVAQW